MKNLDGNLQTCSDKGLFTIEGVLSWPGVVGVEVPQDGSSDTDHLEDLDLFHVTFGVPGLSTFCRLDELGLVAVGQRL